MFYWSNNLFLSSYLVAFSVMRGTCSHGYYYVQVMVKEGESSKLSHTYLGCSVSKKNYLCVHSIFSNGKKPIILSETFEYFLKGRRKIKKLLLFLGGKKKVHVGKTATFQSEICCTTFISGTFLITKGAVHKLRHAAIRIFSHMSQLH